MKNVKIIGFCVILIMLTFSVFYVDVSADPPTEAEGGRNWLTERETVSCGSVTNIPARIPAVTSTFINVIQVLVPVLLVIFGIVDLTKAISSQKEDDITTGRKTLIKRIIIGFLVFLIIALTKLLLNFAVENTALRGSIIECVDCFISGNCQGG